MENKYHYLVNGGSVLPTDAEYTVHKEIKVKSPIYDFQIVDNSVDNIYSIIAKWAVTTPTIYEISVDEPIDPQDFDGNIVQIPCEIYRYEFIEDVVLLLTF
jgi:hypothetical protein